MKILIATLLALSSTAFAQSNKTEPMVDIPAPGQIQSSVEFKGEPGVKASAMIYYMGEEDGGEPGLMILHQLPGDVRYYAQLDNDRLSLIKKGTMHDASELKVNKAGSLVITGGNTTVGRYRWNRELTVAFRKGKYVIAGLTINSIDTITNEENSCDYNLLSGKGTHNGKKVKLIKKPIELITADDTEQMYVCKGWYK